MTWQMRAVGIYTKLTRKPHFVNPRGARALLTKPKKPIEPPAGVLGELDAILTDVDGFPVHGVARTGLDRQNAPTVIYLHGGAFVSEIVKQHWQLVAEIARTYEAVVSVPHYGLAPDHHAAEARSLVAALIDLAERDGRPVYLVGDSAGGNLALLGAQEAVARGVTCVRGVTLMAPWLDLTMANPEIDAMEHEDPWLARAALHEVARVWADGTPLDDPSISPIYGTFEGLPPIDLFIGERDISLPDARLLRDAIREVGEITYHEEPGALHVYPLLPTPEGRRARRDLITRVGELLL